MNYFEHEQKVKYIDGILSKSQDWNWLIKYIEDHFSVDLSINKFDDFFHVFSEISDIFRYFNSINKYIESELCISQEWLKTIYDFSLYYVGKKKYEDLNLDTDFNKVFELLIYLAKLNNETNTQKYTIYAEILNCKNLYKLIDVSNFIREENTIVDRIKSISLNTDEVLKTFKCNINKVFCGCSDFLVNNKNNIIFADCFSYQHLKDTKCATWEESYLRDMLSTKYERGKLTPSIVYTDGNTYPNLDLWTTEIIDIMEEDFNNDDATFILESIRYVLYGVSPSEKVIIRHADLLNDYYDNINHNDSDIKDYSCSSLEYIISVLNDTRIPFDKNLTIVFNKALGKIADIQKLVEIDSRCPIRNNKLKKKINSFINQKLNKAKSITNINEFNDFITDIDIIHKSTKKTFEKISDFFEEGINQCEGVQIAYVFIIYLKYLLGIKNNREIIATDISKEINYIRHLWQDEYMSKSLEAMQTVSKTISLNNEDVDEHNNNILNHPYAIAYNCMLLNNEKIFNTIDEITKTPVLTFVTNIEIKDDFPILPKVIIDDRHEIDMYYKDFVESINNENKYKFLNVFKIEELLPRIYNRIKYNINMDFGMFNKEEVIYSNIVEQNPEYSFIDYSNEPTLAHITQLFPILENKIREIGEFFGITPIREDIDHFNKLKEPTSILKRIITDIYKETDSLELSADFMFVFFTMFAENGLSIRNNCVHGVSYNKKTNEIKFAFKITLFCLHLLDYRFNSLFGKNYDERHG